MRRCLVLALVVLAGALLVHAPAALAAPGDLDPTFGSGGEVVTPLDQGGVFGDVVVRGVALQPDGKLVVVGETVSADSVQLLLARFDAGGTIDTAFGSGGTVDPTPLGDAAGKAVALQPNGKIVVAGVSGNTDA